MLLQVSFFEVQICVKVFKTTINVVNFATFAGYIGFVLFLNKLNCWFLPCLSMQNQSAIFVGFLVFEFCVGKVQTSECLAYIYKKSESKKCGVVVGVLGSGLNAPRGPPSVES